MHLAHGFVLGIYWWTRIEYRNLLVQRRRQPDEDLMDGLKQEMGEWYGLPCLYRTTCCISTSEILPPPPEPRGRVVLWKYGCSMLSNTEVGACTILSYSCFRQSTRSTRSSSGWQRCCTNRTRSLLTIHWMDNEEPADDTLDGW
jgi:hypothetical protein